MELSPISWIDIRTMKEEIDERDRRTTTTCHHYSKPSAIGYTDHDLTLSISKGIAWG
ncbi:hypothetical protein FA13DRAFT_1724052 [Coprinellus micaceus]|uniref:Uncharacterized protein n=1 Tax=Coprinellus micaceus TaxID=71717 RepID=A0A4Y7U062_COPMI|nr:hypothetical protein FA13DRAFT_1724052 [Coprinellus micaceus]